MQKVRTIPHCSNLYIIWYNYNCCICQKCPKRASLPRFFVNFNYRPKFSCTKPYGFVLCTAHSCALTKSCLLVILWILITFWYSLRHKTIDTFILTCYNFLTFGPSQTEKLRKYQGQNHFLLYIIKDLNALLTYIHSLCICLSRVTDKFIFGKYHQRKTATVFSLLTVRKLGQSTLL